MDNPCIEGIKFVDRQFDRFQAPKPPQDFVCGIVDHVSSYVVSNHYYPAHPNDAIARYNYPGLNNSEKSAITRKIESDLTGANISSRQIHLAAWAALMFCWSDVGQSHLDWYKSVAEGGINGFKEIHTQVRA